MDVVSSVKNFFRPQTICIDNKVFKLHYKVTVVILVLSSILVSSKQYLGEPIRCLANDMSYVGVIEAYCWIHSTYTITSNLDGEVGKEIISPGVGQGKHESEVLYHTYYQWMVFFLLAQAVLLYVPRYLWKTWEGGKLKCLAPDMSLCIINEKEKDEKIANIVDYFRDSLQSHNTYAFRFFFCEMLNCAISIVNIVTMDSFLKGGFRDYGARVIDYINREGNAGLVDPMAEVFPKVTKCLFFRVGLTGTLENVDSLCILSINILNEKLMLFLWFWYIILACLSCSAVIYRLVTIISPRVRLSLLAKRCRFTKGFQLRFLRRHMQIGDWFFLYQLSKNMNLRAYKQFIETLMDVHGTDAHNEENTSL